jgi:hypothetical protein
MLRLTALPRIRKYAGLPWWSLQRFDCVKLVG